MKSLTASDSDVRQLIEPVVLAVHRRNGGKLEQLDFELGLLDSQLGIDSLDLAEIIVEIEKLSGKSPFDAASPPKTWGDIALFLKSTSPSAEQ